MNATSGCLQNTQLSCRTVIDDSSELTRANALNQRRDLLVQNAQCKADLRIAQLQETRSHRSTSTKHTARSSRSSLSRSSTLSDKLIEARASLEANKVQSSFTSKDESSTSRTKGKDESSTCRGRFPIKDSANGKGRSSCPSNKRWEKVLTQTGPCQRNCKTQLNAPVNMY